MDLVTALFFFIIILLTLFWLWSQTSRHMSEYREGIARQTRLLDISTMLVKTQGSPPDWHLGRVSADDVHALGLATEDNVLSTAKLDALYAADYQSVREMMGLGSEDFELTVSGNYSGAPVVYYDIGASPPSRERMIVRRYAIFNGTHVELKLQAYYNKTR